VKVLGLPSLFGTAVFALLQLRLKWLSERIDRDTKLLTNFNVLMRIAHARAYGDHKDGVGEAEQDAAIAAIWVLGTRDKILRAPAIQALETIATFKKSAEPYRDNLKKVFSKSDMPPNWS